MGDIRCFMQKHLIILLTVFVSLLISGCESYRWTKEVDVTETIEEGYRLVFPLDAGTHRLNIKSNVMLVIEIVDAENNVTELRTPVLTEYAETLEFDGKKILYIQNEWGSGGTATVAIRIDKKIF